MNRSQFHFSSSLVAGPPRRNRVPKAGPAGRAALLRALPACGALLLPLLLPASLSAQAAQSAPDTPVAPAPPATRPAAPAATPSPADADRPLLRELDRETREMYRQLQGGVLRVQIPEPQWARAAPAQDNNNWLNRYQLSPKVRQQLMDQQQQAQQANPLANSISNSTSNGISNNASGNSINNDVNPTNPADPAGRAALNNATNNAKNGGNSGNSSNTGNSKNGNGANDRPNLTIIVPPANSITTNSVQGPAAPGPQQGQQAQQERPAPQATQQQATQQQATQQQAPPPPNERQNSTNFNNGQQDYAPQGYAAPGQVQGQGAANAGATFSPNNVGLLLDDQGHVLVPQFVDREALGDQLIHLTGASGAVLDAKLVGSDQQTGLTVLQLLRPAGKRSATKESAKAKVAKAEPAKGTSEKAGTADKADTADVDELGEMGKPVLLAKSKPADGSLVLLLSPGDGTGRLGVWSGGGRDYGVVVNIDGQVAGVTRFGQFLGGPACQLIADQIIRNGAVRRATLGVIITQIEKEDPQRAAQPLLGDRPAVRVDQVMQRSVAERGGLKQGDVLLSLDGEPVNDIPTLAAAVAAKTGRTRLRVLRGDQVLVLTVDLQQK